MGKSIIVCDIDGVLADVGHRLHYVLEIWPKDWTSFFAKAVEDKPNKELITGLNQMRLEGKTIVLATGRPERYRKQTEYWLEQHNVPYDKLLMRPQEDFRPGVDLKEWWLESGDYGEVKDIELAIDNDNKIARMYVKHEIPAKVISFENR